MITKTKTYPTLLDPHRTSLLLSLDSFRSISGHNPWCRRHISLPPRTDTPLTPPDARICRIRTTPGIAEFGNVKADGKVIALPSSYPGDRGGDGDGFGDKNDGRGVCDRPCASSLCLRRTFKKYHFPWENWCKIELKIK